MNDAALVQKPNVIVSERARNITKFKVGDAALLVGKSPPTLGRAVKSGKLSITKDSNGDRLYELAELERVYGSLNFSALEQNQLDDEVSQENEVVQRVSLEKNRSSSPDAGKPDLKTENLLLKQEVKSLNILMEQKDSSHEEYKKIVEASLQKLLTQQSDINLTEAKQGDHFWRNTMVASALVGLVVAAVYFSDDLVQQWANFTAVNSSSVAVESETPQG